MAVTFNFQANYAFERDKFEIRVTVPGREPLVQYMTVDQFRIYTVQFPVGGPLQVGDPANLATQTQVARIKGYLETVLDSYERLQRKRSAK